MIGSILVFFSLIGVTYAQNVADFLGIGRAADLYLYLSLLTIFYLLRTLNRFDELNKKISILTKRTRYSKEVFR